MNINHEQIKALIFDSGHVLNRPRSGHWFFTENFTKILGKNIFESADEKYNAAFEKAYRYLNENHFIKNEIEEYEQFKTFYAIFLNEINFHDVSPHIICELSRDTVFNDSKFEFFDDVKDTLETLRNKYILGIISDTWPSLERVYKNYGIRDYFTSFIMSSVYNSVKENGTLFEIALEEINLKPCEIIFVDDAENNLLKAEQMGFISIKMDRYYKSDNNLNFITIHSLKELANLDRLFTK